MMSQMYAQGEYDEYKLPVMLSQSRILIGCGGNYVDIDRFYASDDGGVSWKVYFAPVKFANAVFPDSTTGFAVKAVETGDTDPYQVYKSTDGGKTWLWNMHAAKWSSMAPQSPAIRFVTPLNGYFAPTVVWQVDSIPIYRTTDGGASWNTMDVDSASKVALAYSPSVYFDSLNGYSMDRYGGLNRTTNGGMDWTYDQQLIASSHVGALVKAGTSIMAYETRSEMLSIWQEMLVTHDLGKTWESVYQYVTKSSQRINEIGFFDTTYAIAWNQSFLFTTFDSIKRMPVRSTNGGRSWDVIDTPIKEYSGHSFWSDGTGYVTDRKAVYKTTDYGETWNQVAVVTGIEGRCGHAPPSFRLDHNYPNPVGNDHKQTTISFSVGKSTQIRLSVYDIMGREIRTIVDAFRSPGSYTERLDVSGLPPGVYLITMLAGNNPPMVRRMVVR
jgi:photosystem II stability/assembly factor-like uncharacterized protein